MATNNQLVSMAQQFTGLPMGSLIGGPLMAAAKANNTMALSQVNFMLTTCFYVENDAYKPVMIEMELIRGVIIPGATPADKPTMEEISTTIRLPLLTIIPLNSLAVDNVDITFEMEVKSSYGESESAQQQNEMQAEASFEAKLGYGPFSVSISGSVSASSSSSSEQESHYEKSNSAKYTVAVHAGQLPLPDGVKTIIDAYSQNIAPIELPAPVTP
ncbi:DUF2589 domain-containing protein [Emcibacter sp.]|uniref:DUF2589 domain-containing protein n=1 Tax=Emcibacter sp. TaxID=1979954 RepID=UPI003A8DD7E1